jgi:hypothetical protein
MLRGLRRRLHEARNAPLARFTLRVLAVSPFPEEPEKDENYQPSLIVDSSPAPDDPSLSPVGFAIGALLFVEWAYARQEEVTLTQRLHALLPRLRVAVRGGHLGPARYAAHRAGQRERYFHHREAATYEVAIHRDELGLFVAVRERVAKGPWTAAATLLEAATLAPYEALLRLERDEALATLDWLAAGGEHWPRGRTAGFPVAEWELTGELRGPGRDE